jgi:hypothetical protein
VLHRRLVELPAEIAPTRFGHAGQRSVKTLEASPRRPCAAKGRGISWELVAAYTGDTSGENVLETAPAAFLKLLVGFAEVEVLGLQAQIEVYGAQKALEPR